MKPIDAYSNTIQRARYFLRLHDGLVNVRSRSVRSDWKSAFCKLMHWPKNASIERVDSKDAVIVLRDAADLAPDDFSANSLDDLLRASLTFGVSALDRYIHERVVQEFVNAYKKGNLNRQQTDFQIPATLAINIIDKIYTAKKKGNNPRPSNEIRNAVQEILHKRPFQSWREIEYAFQLIGVKNLTGQMQNEFRLADMQPVKNQLNKIVSPEKYSNTLKTFDISSLSL